MSAAAPALTPQVAIVGGGLAGLAAAVALAGRGWKIDLLEARRQLGGRATSFFDAPSGSWIDHCQHVSLGCCTNLADFCRRTGLDDLLQCQRTLHFIGPAGQHCQVAASRWLPAPLHLLPSLLRLNYLSWPQRWAMIRALRQLIAASTHDDPHGQTIGQWLREHGQTPQAIELFWEPVIVSALSETVDRAAVPPVRKVFVDAFLRHRRAYEMHVPQVPLSDFYGRPLEAWLEKNQVQLRLECPVKQLVGDERGLQELELASGQRLRCDAVILAVPWRRVGELLPAGVRAALPELGGLEQIESAPITGVHVWFDRPLTNLPHAVLPGRTSQWMFYRGLQTWVGKASESPVQSHYYQIVISASRNLAALSREQIISQVVAELSSIWPAASQAKLLQARLITEQHAVFSVRPGIESYRPSQRTGIGNLFLAGDWTATGWPATMEGAVRSGYLAAEGVLSYLKQPAPQLVPDLPPAWLSHRILGQTR